MIRLLVMNPNKSQLRTKGTIEVSSKTVDGTWQFPLEYCVF